MLTQIQTEPIPKNNENHRKKSPYAQPTGLRRTDFCTVIFSFLHGCNNARLTLKGAFPPDIPYNPENSCDLHLS